MRILFLFLLLLALTTSSCVFAANESTAKINDTSDEERQLRRTRRKKIHKIKPKETPKTVKDSEGKFKRRKSIVDLSELMLGDDEDDVDIQLMSDEAPQTLKMKRGSRKAGSYESWYGMDANNGHHLTMVKTKTPWGETVTTGTMFGKNGTVYQIRTLADGNVVAEEVKQGMFDMEFEGPKTDGDGDDNPETIVIIDAIDGFPGGGRRHLRRLDSSSEIDIMVSPETNF